MGRELGKRVRAWVFTQESAMVRVKLHRVPMRIYSARA